jgi:hypothetical protein
VPISEIGLSAGHLKGDVVIHRENLALFKRRLAEAKDDATRELLLKLIAEEEGNRRFPRRADCFNWSAGTGLFRPLVA